MKHILVVLVLLGSLIACGNDKATISRSLQSPEAASPSIDRESTPSPEQSIADATTTVELWFSVAAGHLGAGLFVVRREIPSTPGIGAATLRQWLAGPTPDEAAAGVLNTVPKGTELLGLEIQGGTAVVDLSSEFERTNMGTSGEIVLLEQLAWTLTQFPTVDRVLLKIDGEFRDHYLGHGFIIDVEHPLERNRRDPLAPILVSEPRFGERFASGDAVEGTANVFEANVSIRLLDEEGNTLTETFTTATCGTGCRGDYSKRLRYEVDHEQAGTIELFEASAEDGSETNKITIPVVLSP